MAQLTNVEVSYKEKEFFEHLSNEGEPLELRKTDVLIVQLLICIWELMND